MSYFLGIDTGGTKTHALIANHHGRVLGMGQAGPGNHEVVGYDGVIAALRQSNDQALAQAGITIAEIAGAGFGIAGYDFPSERADTLAAIATLGLTCPLEVTNDVVLGLIAGARDGWGIAIDAGTGNNVRGRDRNGREGWVTGCGDTFGEYGGAGEMVARAIKMISHHWSHRGQPTALSDIFIQALGARDLSDLIEGLALGVYHTQAAQAQLIFQVAAQGDVVAQEVIRWTATELGETAKAVIRQLGIENEAFDAVLIGSVFKGGPLFIQPLTETICVFAPRVNFTHLEVPPVSGAVLLGMEMVNLRGDELRENLFTSLKTGSKHAQ
jgi:N-acetylglucosamine kinase-like BadF-type ATPase